METIHSVKILETVGLQEIGFDDDETWDRATKTLTLNTVRWSVADPNMLAGRSFTLKWFLFNSGSYTNDMTLQPGQDNHGYTECVFVGA